MQKRGNSPVLHSSETVRLGSNQRNPPGGAAAPGGQVWAMSEADVVREQLRKVMEKMLHLQNQVQESCGLGGEELREVQQLALQSAAILEQPSGPNPGASEVGLRSGLQGGAGSEVKALKWIGEQYGMESGQEAISSGLDGAAAFGQEVNGSALEDGGVGAEGSGGGASNLQSFGIAEAPLGETASPERVSQKGGDFETEDYTTFLARTRPPHASPSVQGEAALSDGPCARSSEGSVSEDKHLAVKNAPAVETAELAAAEERRLSPGSTDPQAAPQNPQTPAKVCVKTEWSEEPETPNPLVSNPMQRVSSEGLSQADPGVNGFQEWRGPVDEDDVGSGLEDDDDGFNSEPEPEPVEPEQEQGLNSCQVATLLFPESEEEEEGGERERQEAESDSVLDQRVRPKKTKVVKKGVKKLGKKKQSLGLESAPKGGYKRAEKRLQVGNKAIIPEGETSECSLAAIEMQLVCSSRYDGSCFKGTWIKQSSVELIYVFRKFKFYSQ
jgi:hypothetical protein